MLFDEGPRYFKRRSSSAWAKEHGIELRFIQTGKPNQNAFIERFNKSFRDEVLDAHLFNTLSEAQEAAEIWLEDYNKYRPMSPLGGCHQQSLNPGFASREPLLSICSLDG